MTNETLTIALPKAAVWVRDAIRADRANAYGLDAPWVLPKLGGDLHRRDLMPPDFSDRAWHIAGGVITELPFPADPALCDGCTLSPDYWPKSWGGIKAFVGAIFHDRWYRHLEIFARAWGWKVERVRKLGDILFRNILRSMARRLPFWSRQRAYLATSLYYAGVRAFGGAAHAAYKRLEGSKAQAEPGGAAGPDAPDGGALPVFLAILCAFAAGGCSGCVALLAWENPDVVIDIPAHSYTNLVTGEHWSYEPHSQASGGGADETAPAGEAEPAGWAEGR